MNKYLQRDFINLIKYLLRRYLLQKYIQFFKYCIGGGVAFIIDLSLLYILTEYAHIWYLYSATLAFIVASIFNYSFQKFITFKDKNKQYTKQFLFFVLIAVVGLLINNSLLYIQVEWLKIWYMLAKAVAAAFVLIWNFFMNKYITFKAL